MDLSGAARKFEDWLQPIVIDNGTGSVKAGFATDDIPTCVFPSVVGKPDKLRQRDVLVGVQSRDAYVGDDAQEMRGLLTLNYPMRHGIVTDWEDMERIWHHTFWKELSVNPAEHPVLMTEAPQNPTKHRVQMFQTMFEAFNVPAMYVSIQAVLSLYASGNTTGVVIDSGDGVTHVVPIFEGYAVPSAIKRLDLAGRDLTEFLITLVMESSGLSLQSSAGFEIAKEMKESMCYVHPNYDAAIQDLNTANADRCAVLMNEYNKTYEGMPDGSEVTIGPERFICPEALFKPALVGMDAPGIHQLVVNSIQKCQFDIRQKLYNNIVLSGGTTVLSGLKERLEAEIRQLSPAAMTPKLAAPVERKYSVWIGGSILASLSSFHKKWITKEEFNELGPYALKGRMF